MVRKYECEGCAFIHTEIRSMSDPSVLSMIRQCEQCGNDTKFELLFEAPYITAGMLTKKYTGQTAAVQGWGTYNLDYGKSKSDLVAGRAREAADATPTHVRS